MITTVTLNPSLDMTLQVEKLVPDDSNRVSSVQKDPGGKGLNVSRIAHRLGSAVMTIGLFGGHTGDEIESLLKQEGIVPFTIRVAGDTRTNVTILETQRFTQTRFNQEGPRVSPDEYKSLLNMVRLVGNDANIVVLSGSIPPGIPEDAYEHIILMLKQEKSDIKIILDSDTKALLHGLKARPYLVKPNIHEAERLLGRSIVSQADQIQALKDIRQMGVDVVVISLGREGLIGFDGTEIIAITPPAVEVKSTVGAGDALVAGLCMAMESGKSFSEMLAFGVLVSTAKVNTPGTGACGWEAVHAIKEAPKVVRV